MEWIVVLAKNIWALILRPWHQLDPFGCNLIAFSETISVKSNNVDAMVIVRLKDDVKFILP
jgi:hypothetical protein